MHHPHQQQHIAIALIELTRHQGDDRNVTTSHDDVITANNMTSQSVDDVSFGYVCLCYDFVIETVFMGLLCVLGFAGNAASTVCLWHEKSNTATPFLLISLEIADTLFLVTVFILRVIPSVDTFAVKLPWLEGVAPYFGKYVYPCAIIAQTGTIYLTILVTLNRYISVCHPYRASRLCSVKYARRQVAVVCFFALLFSLPRFFEYDVSGEWRLVETALLKHTVYKVVYSNLFYFLVLFFVPLLTLAFLNQRLITALRETRRKRAQLLRQMKDAPSHSEDDITLMLIVVVMVFVVFQTPAMFTQVLDSSLSNSDRLCPSWFFFYARISDLLVVANSSINFIIYCFCSRRFRQILRNLVCGADVVVVDCKTARNGTAAADRWRDKTSFLCWPLHSNGATVANDDVIQL